MMFVILVCLAATASALPTPESSDGPDIVGRNSENDKNLVEFTFAPQRSPFRNGIPVIIPPAPQLPPLYLFSYEDLMSKDKNKENEEGKNPEEGKSAYKTVFVKDLSDYIAALPFLSYFDSVTDFFSSLFGDSTKYRYVMIIPQQ